MPYSLLLMPHLFAALAFAGIVFFEVILLDGVRGRFRRPGELRTKSKNTPFDEWTMRGRALLTLVDGEIVFDDRAAARRDRVAG